MVIVAVGVAVEDSKEASLASWYFQPDFKMKNNQILHISDNMRIPNHQSYCAAPIESSLLRKEQSFRDQSVLSVIKLWVMIASDSRQLRDYLHRNREIFDI